MWLVEFDLGVKLFMIGFFIFLVLVECVDDVDKVFVLGFKDFNLLDELFVWFEIEVLLTDRKSVV